MQNWSIHFGVRKAFLGQKLKKNCWISICACVCERERARKRDGEGRWGAVVPWATGGFWRNVCNQLQSTQPARHWRLSWGATYQEFVAIIVVFLPSVTNWVLQTVYAVVLVVFCFFSGENALVLTQDSAFTSELVELIGSLPVRNNALPNKTTH